jgi:DNA-binding transcriptional regulator YiaG
MNYCSYVISIERKMAKKTHLISELGARMNPAVLEKACRMVYEESLNNKLGMLREKCGIKQSEIANFTQTAVSKLENRKDIRISTLMIIWTALVWVWR